MTGGAVVATATSSTTTGTTNDSPPQTSTPSSTPSPQTVAPTSPPPQLQPYQQQTKEQLDQYNKALADYNTKLEQYNSSINDFTKQESSLQNQLVFAKQNAQAKTKTIVDIYKAGYPNTQTWYKVASIDPSTGVSSGITDIPASAYEGLQAAEAQARANLVTLTNQLQTLEQNKPTPPDKPNPIQDAFGQEIKDYLTPYPVKIVNRAPDFGPDSIYNPTVSYKADVLLNSGDVTRITDPSPSPEEVLKATSFASLPAGSRLYGLYNYDPVHGYTEKGSGNSYQDALATAADLGIKVNVGDKVQTTEGVKVYAASLINQIKTFGGIVTHDNGLDALVTFSYDPTSKTLNIGQGAAAALAESNATKTGLPGGGFGVGGPSTPTSERLGSSLGQEATGYITRDSEGNVQLKYSPEQMSSLVSAIKSNPEYGGQPNFLVSDINTENSVGSLAGLNLEKSRNTDQPITDHPLLASPPEGKADISSLSGSKTIDVGGHKVLADLIFSPSQEAVDRANLSRAQQNQLVEQMNQNAQINSGIDKLVFDKSIDDIIKQAKESGAQSLDIFQNVTNGKSVFPAKELEGVPLSFDSILSSATKPKLVKSIPLSEANVKADLINTITNNSGKDITIFQNQTNQVIQPTVQNENNIIAFSKVNPAKLSEFSLYQKMEQSKNPIESLAGKALVTTSAFGSSVYSSIAPILGVFESAYLLPARYTKFINESKNPVKSFFDVLALGSPVSSSAVIAQTYGNQTKGTETLYSPEAKSVLGKTVTQNEGLSYGIQGIMEGKGLGNFGKGSGNPLYDIAFLGTDVATMLAGTESLLAKVSPIKFGTKIALPIGEGGALKDVASVATIGLGEKNSMILGGKTATGEFFLGAPKPEKLPFESLQPVTGRYGPELFATGKPVVNKYLTSSNVLDNLVASGQMTPEQRVSLEAAARTFPKLKGNIEIVRTGFGTSPTLNINKEQNDIILKAISNQGDIVLKGSASQPLVFPVNPIETTSGTINFGEYEKAYVDKLVNPTSDTSGLSTSTSSSVSSPSIESPSISEVPSSSIDLMVNNQVFGVNTMKAGESEPILSQSMFEEMAQRGNIPAIVRTPVDKDILGLTKEQALKFNIDRVNELINDKSLEPGQFFETEVEFGKEEKISNVKMLVNRYETSKPLETEDIFVGFKGKPLSSNPELINNIIPGLEKELKSLGVSYHGADIDDALELVKGGVKNEGTLFTTKSIGEALSYTDFFEEPKSAAIVKITYRENQLLDLNRLTKEEQDRLDVLYKQVVKETGGFERGTHAYNLATEKLVKEKGLFGYIGERDLNNPKDTYWVGITDKRAIEKLELIKNEKEINRLQDVTGPSKKINIIKEPKSFLSGKTEDLEFHHITENEGVILTKEEHAGIEVLMGKIIEPPKIKGAGEVLKYLGEKPEMTSKIKSGLLALSTEKKQEFSNILGQAAKEIKSKRVVNSVPKVSHKLIEYPEHNEEQLKDYPSLSKEYVFGQKITDKTFKFNGVKMYNIFHQIGRKYAPSFEYHGPKDIRPAEGRAPKDPFDVYSISKQLGQNMITKGESGSKLFDFQNKALIKKGKEIIQDMELYRKSSGYEFSEIPVGVDNIIGKGKTVTRNNLERTPTIFQSSRNIPKQSKEINFGLIGNKGNLIQEKVKTPSPTSPMREESPIFQKEPSPIKSLETSTRKFNSEMTKSPSLKSTTGKSPNYSPLTKSNGSIKSPSGSRVIIEHSPSTTNSPTNVSPTSKTPLSPVSPSSPKSPGSAVSSISPKSFASIEQSRLGSSSGLIENPISIIPKGFPKAPVPLLQLNTKPDQKKILKKGERVNFLGNSTESTLVGLYTRNEIVTGNKKINRLSAKDFAMTVKGFPKLINTKSTSFVKKNGKPKNKQLKLKL